MSGQCFMHQFSKTVVPKELVQYMDTCLTLVVGYASIFVAHEQVQLGA